MQCYPKKDKSNIAIYTFCIYSKYFKITEMLKNRRNVIEKFELNSGV